MDSEQFVKTVQTAAETGNAAAIYIAKLVARVRTFTSELEKAKVSAAVIAALRDIALPVRTEALAILTACSELAEDVESAWIALSTGEDDLRSKVRPYTEERKAREAAEKAAEEESKQRLQDVEDNLLVSGRA